MTALFLWWESPYLEFIPYIETGPWQQSNQWILHTKYQQYGKSSDGISSSQWWGDM